MITDAEKVELRKAVRSAGDLLMSMWPGRKDSTAPPLEVKEKPDGSCVTNADFRSNDMLMSALTRLFPNDAIHSEEVVPDENLFLNERVWIIDPLDGTSGYASGTEQFSILVALTSKGRPYYGLMLYPSRGLLFEAERGKGATKNGESIRVSHDEIPRKEGVYARHTELRERDWLFPSHLDSGVALGRVANGELDAAVFRLSKLREWDLAAPALIIEEAGGKVSDEFGNQVKFEIGSLPRYFLASNSACHQRTLDSIIL